MWSRYSENGGQVQSNPDSMWKFKMDYYYEQIIIKSLKHEFGAINWVFLTTQKDTDHLSSSELVI